MAQLEEACAARGRTADDIDIALFGAPDDQAQLQGRIEQGFNELIFSLPAAPADKVLPLLDRYAELAAACR